MSRIRKKIPEKLLRAVRDAKTVLIASHINPDGDALGSMIGLGLALRQSGKRVILYNRDSVPDIYRFLPGHRAVTDRMPKRIASPAVAILLDCNSPERAGIRSMPCETSVVIDHHETESDFGTIRWIDPAAAATGMMIYDLVSALGTRLTKEIATNLYVALAIDTGTFRYGSTSAAVLRVAADLVEAGADPAATAAALYENWSEARFALLLKALGTFSMREGVAMMHVTSGMFRTTGATAADTENFANVPRQMGNIRVSALFRQVDGSWKVSLRARNTVNVAEIAASFGGGGHRNAAGYKTDADLASAKRELLSRLRSAGQYSAKRRTSA